jgi:tRNA A-37 threonylcarbamoyl transferase component Bud32
MIPCRIVFNHLPAEVLDAVLRVDEVKMNDPRWTLLRSGNTRKIYHFQPNPEKPSWIVKWGCRYTSLKKISGALTGRDQATLEWAKTRKAEECHLPVIPFSLLAVPRIQSGRIHSLLVSPYLEKSLNLIQFLSAHRDHPARVHQTLTQLGRIVYDIHTHNLLHQDLSLDNVLIQDGDPEKLFIIDWFKMKELPKGNTELFGADLIAPLCDLFYVGTPDCAKKAFLESYTEKGTWLEGRFQEVIEKARKARIRIIERAWKNCNRKNRGIIRYRYRGYSVFLLKGKDRESVNRSIDAELKSPSIRSQWRSKKENSPILERWRRANALRASGAIRHPVMAYAVQKRLFRIREILIEEPE